MIFLEFLAVIFSGAMILFSSFLADIGSPLGGDI
jgi:hypothetical protein